MNRIQRKFNTSFVIAGLLCLGMVAPAAVAADMTTTLLTLTNSTYPTNGFISVLVTDTSTATVPTGTVTVTINGVGQTINLNTNGANTAVGTTQIVSQAGSYTVSAAYNSSNLANFLASNDAGGTLTISKATLTITPSPVTITYGASPVFTTAITGYVNGDTPPVLGATGARGATTSNATLTNGNPNAGPWTITPNVGTLASTNYTYAVATAALTVNKPALTVTANSPAPIVYGSAAPVLSATVTGQVNGDGVGGFAGTATVVSNATLSAGAAVQNVGTWTTTASVGSLTSANYTFTFVTGSYSVTQRTLTVTPGNVSSNYGTAPVYTSSITNFVAGDTVGNSTTGAATYSLPTATLTNGLPNQGSWPIAAVVTGLSSSNYSFVAGTNATLTVSPVTLTVSALTPAAIFYPNATPTFTPSYAGFVNSDTALTALTGAPSYTNNATLANNNKPNAGTWSSIPAAGTLAANNGNYTFSFTNGSFTVNQAVLTLTANNPASTAYGNTFPGFTTTIAGYVNNDNSFNAYTGTPAVASANATTTNGLPNVGSWTITPQIGTLASTNYTFTLVTGQAVVTPAVLTITANPLTINYGAAAVYSTVMTGAVNGENVNAIPGATGTQGATTSNATLTNLNPNAGTWVITPSAGTLAAPNYTYTIATGTLQVNKVALTIAANNQTITYGGTPTPSATVTGLVNGDGGTASLTTPAATTSFGFVNVNNAPGWTIIPAAGTIPVSNYNVTLTNGLLVVNPLAITITALGQTVTYGAAFNSTAGAGTVTVATLVAGDTGVPTLASNATFAPSGFPTAGTFTITPAGGTISSTNYTITPVTATFQVNQRALVISAAPATITYGAATPTFSPTYTTFVTGDTAGNSTAGAPSFTTNATLTNGNPNASTGWNIIPALNGTTSTNYSLSVFTATGGFVVNKAPITVTAQSPAAITYGTVFPSFTASFGNFVNGDTVAVVSGSAGFTHNATVTVGNPLTVPNFGTWTITPTVGSLTAANYAFTTFVFGSITVNKALLSVNANSFQPITYGAPAPAFSYNVSGFVNGDAPGVVSGTAALSSNATFANGNPNAGTFTITPAVGTLVSANANYAFTVFNTGQFTVNKANLNITATSQSIVYGNAPSGAVTYNFVNADTVGTAFTGGAPTVGNNATLTNLKPNVGSWTITPAFGTLASNNYNLVTPVTGTLTVTPATVTVTANSPAGITYGQANPAVSSSFGVFVNGDTAGTALTGAPNVATNATVNANTTFQNAGTWTTTASAGAPGNLTAVNGNYTFTFVTGSYTVSKAPLSVTAPSPTITYGSAAPVFTPAYATFVTGDTIANALTGAPVVTSNATLTNGNPNAGSWITTAAPGTLAAVNYTFSFVTGTFTVNTAPLTLTATPQTITYGALPALSGTSVASVTVTGLVNGDTGTPALTTNATATVGTFPNDTNGTPWVITPAAGTIPASNYTVTPVTANLTVAKKAITLTAVAQTLTYGAIPNLTPGAGTVTVATLVAGDTAQPTLSTNATATVGTFPNATNGTPWVITPAAGNISATNYTITPVTANLVVNKASLTVTALNQSITYGAAVNLTPGVGTVTVTSLVAGDNSAPSLGTNAALVNGNPIAGTFNIVPSAGTISTNNYSIVLNNGTLTVAQASLTISALPQTITYGASQNLTPGAGTVTVTGLVNGDSGAPSLSSNATLTSGKPNAGVWAITPAAGTLTNTANYNITVNAASLTVNKAVLTATANSPANITYGTASPALTAAITGLVNGDTATAYTGAPTLATNATVAAATGFQNVGNWTITIGAGSLASANYSFTLVNGAYSVLRAPLNISANSLSTLFGTAPPYSSTITGYVTGDTAATAFTGTITYTTNATLSNNFANVGTWIITPVIAGLTSANYALSAVTGTLNVRAVPPPSSGGAPPSGGGGPLTLTASPGALTFTGPAGAVSPSPQSFQVTSTPSGTGVTVIKGSAPWLTITQGATTTPTTVAVTVSVVGLAAGTYKETITAVSADGSTTVSTQVTLVVTASTNINISQGASFGAAVAPNTAIAIFGNFSCPKPSVLAATVNGVSATIFAAVSTQVNLAIPEISATGSVPVQITCDATVIGSGVTQIAAQAPGLFTLNFSGTGGGAILNNGDSSVNTPSNGAPIGSYIAVYGTGFGLLSPAGDDTLQHLPGTVTATIGGVPATVVYAGEVPGVTHALQQINIQIPANAPRGIAVPIVITVNGVSTQAGVTVSIQ